MVAPSASAPISENLEFEEFERDCATTGTTGRFPALRSLIRNWTVLRAVAPAAATVVLIAIHHSPWVPFAISAYAISNAAAITLGSARSARAA
ncbi:hypothetical protein GPX89_04085 [Nocardia sp. ET3-3]|uniref:Uncharacterized protein n=1 Tax=Nocardia terrae TaxID=2675851 RepID=A0A7K1UQ08_9NOCA|nr:hypothetical protein [Nocardia terrae]MVU76421.1 hypothetical protein [Nocardia terrae]